ncbi:hypothetical protein NDU88_000343 [Pleurodeles waltl]|uniref:Uncharacterized protein n=1 Tax=Pleurodeles waltl TaxID=8319 RepID=A0AAV7S4A2_PLEWA|nr:hypothetical protein NDU88_000343 [Pleurodeles waltl]
MEPNRVVQALKVLHDEGREDLLKEGILEQAWVGIKRPKRLSADGVSAAVAACTSPVKQSKKKFKMKSVGGRKLSRSPQSGDEPLSSMQAAAVGVAGKRRGVCRFPRRQGVSLARRVAAGGRGAASVGAVRTTGRKGARAVFAHARVIRRSQRAPSPVETGGEREGSSLEERALGGARKMAAPLVSDWSDDRALEERQLRTAGKMAAPVLTEEDEVLVISDTEEEELGCQEGVGVYSFGAFGNIGREGVGRGRQGFNRGFSPMMRKVQTWHLDNEAFKLGEQVGVVDSSGRVLSGKVCGEYSGYGSKDRVMVQLELLQASFGEGPSGCDTPPVLGGQGVKAVYRPSGRMAGGQSTPVKVRAPSAHRPEGRARSGAVRLTSRETHRVREAQPSTSQGAGDGWDDWCDDLLDYEEDVEVQVPSKHSEQSQSETSGAVQGGQVPERSHILSASGFPRGEEGLGVFGLPQGGNVGRGVSGCPRGNKEISHKVDAAIQANVVTEVGKLEPLQSYSPLFMTVASSEIGAFPDTLVPVTRQRERKRHARSSG